MTLKHSLVSAIPDDPASTTAGEVTPTDWNADHVIATSLKIPTSNTANYVTVAGAATTVIPSVEASGSDASVPLKLGYKGDQGYVQAGTDSYGAAGWAGYDLNIEVVENEARTGSSYGIYVAKGAKDVADSYLEGLDFIVSTQADAANGNASIYGVLGTAASQAPVGKTNLEATGGYLSAAQIGAGTLTNAYGFTSSVSASSSGVITNGIGVRVRSAITASGGTITTNYGLKVENQTVGGTNYNCWFGSGLYHFDALTASQFVTTDASKNLVSSSAATAAGLLVGGSNTQIQFNDSSVFGGDAGLTYNKTTDTLTAVGSLVSGAGTAAEATSAPGVQVGASGYGLSQGSNVVYICAAGYPIASVRSDSSVVELRSSGGYVWSPGVNLLTSPDTGIFRNAAGVVEINNASAGTYRDIIGRSLLSAPSSANGQSLGVKSLTELLTIAAAATSTTTIQKPANSIVLAVSVRVTTAVTCTSTFTVGDSGSATRFSTAAVSKAVNSTDKGTAAGAYYNATAEGVVITPDTTPSDATGRVRVTIHYIEVTPPTS